MESLFQDLKHAGRHIRRSPSFALAAMTTLALSIGANTATFSILKALTWQRLAIDDPDGLLAIAPRTSRGTDRSTPVDAIAHLQDGPLSPLCGYLGGIVLPVLANGAPVQASTTFITGQCLNTFGVHPILGRGITDEDAPLYGRGARVALITHRLWQRLYHGDAAVLGRTIQVNNIDVEIVGVLPPRFIGLEVDHGVDIYTPFDTVVLATPARRQLAGFLLGRLKAGVTVAAAETELRARWPALLDAVLPSTLPPSELANFRDSIVQLERMATGRSVVRTRYSQPLTLIAGLTLLLLVLACVNLGGLLLARLTERSSELSVRLALGGSRRRIARQMWLESLLVALGGSVLAVPLAFGIVRALVALLPPANLPNTMSFTPDFAALAAMAVVAVIVAAVMSAVPLWVAMRQQGTTHLTWNRTIAGATNRWSRVLLVVQVTVSMVLLIGAALLTRSLYLLQHNNLGIRSADVLTVRTLPLPGSGNQRRNALSDFNVYVDRIAALPGVRGAAFSRGFPRGATLPGVPVQFVDQEPAGLTTGSDYVSLGFFDMLGIRRLSGRVFTAADEASMEPVAIVSASLARGLAPDGNVVGKRIKFGPIPGDQNRMIVGVVSDATQGDPRVAAPHVVYRPLQLRAESSLSGNLLIQTGDPATAASGVRNILREVGRDYAVEIAGADEVIARTPASERMSAAVAGGIGILAVILALMGVHSVLAYSVARRQREIGVRVAIGATPGGVARAIVRDGLTLTAIGTVFGLAVAAIASQFLRSLLFGITELDAATFLVAGGSFLALGAAAGVIPAWRAASVDPVRALRGE